MATSAWGGCGCLENKFTLYLETNAGRIAYSWGSHVDMFQLGLRFMTAKLSLTTTTVIGKQRLAPINQRDVLRDALDRFEQNVRADGVAGSSPSAA